MSTDRHLRARYRRILRFAARYIAQEWWFEVVLPRVGLARLSWRGRAKRAGGIARHFHALALDLGGLMIKVGQFMSSRLDVLPTEITSELEGLQDEVPPADFAEVRTLAETDLGVPLERAFSFFDPSPIAAASLGQVHRARLSPADAELMGFADVVVKIQRPGIDAIVAVDLAALRKVAGWLNRVAAISRRVDLPALVKEFAAVSMEEIDYLHEGANAERFAENFSDNPGVRAPTVVWERSTRRVLALSDVAAIKINDRESLIAAGIDPAAVAVGLSSAMFDQLFVHGFFHADPHPGNIFVTPHSPAAGGPATGWALTFVDFGMMGEVPDTLKSGLQRLVIAVAARDSQGLVSSIRAMGMLLPSAESAPLERALGELFDRFGGLGFAELQNVDPHEFRDFAKKFGDTMRTMPFQLPEDLLLIIRAVSVTSGVCTSLNPAFNIWTAIEPYAARLGSNAGGAAARAVFDQVVATAGVIARLPGQLDELSTLVQRGRLSMEIPGIERRLRALEKLVLKGVSALLFAALLFGGIFLKESEPVFGWVLIFGSALPLLHAVFAGMGGRGRDF
ncbi:putative unusual protein kinase regulating ubiquinone biosynthesis (AarF/ABC1/UbiB family) [Homoserinimonas aerilata]|uniref:Putative unusual protein kinase regulating ubiquinone biosynthesis (AarF/ABC1/UbiB family) n=2 Tax=Homoserinimonas aerilata TaxID=1162970 RepID=A0A542YJ30_9MICO|nr:putative unusual protein kinase regulating ubiquinone biosynthesis (AarF/ABC1/UbiB family) [Homoserinimonas aerilata]